MRLAAAASFPHVYAASVKGSKPEYASNNYLLYSSGLSLAAVVLPLH